MMKKIILFIGLFFIHCGMSISQTLIMNEVSNGPTGNQEYVEFVVVSDTVVYNCNASTPPCIDIRGWIFDDNSGYHGPSGIANGAVRFSQDPLWACVPLGTIIVLYNDADPNPDVPANDLSLADGNCKIVAPISSVTLFEKNITTPGAAACSYPATGWVPGGIWTYTALANSSDCARIVNLSGCEVFSVCYGAADNLNSLIYFPAAGGGIVYSFNSVDPMLQANWTSGSATTMQTPGAPNNAANAAYIAQFNNGCLPITPIVVTATSVNSGCGCTGSATASASGSIGGYTYAWYDAGYNAMGQNTATATGLCAGVYHVIGTSHINCSDTATVTITSGGSVSATTSQTNVSCNAGTNGTATVTASGGTPTYTYVWTPSGGSASTATGLVAGNYTCTITDANSCSVIKTFVITQPTTLTVTTTTVAATCGSANGQATAIPLGGTGTYTYAWTPSGGAAATATGLAAGNYTITVTDANLCAATAPISIISAGSMSATASQTNVSCNAGTNGTATVNPSGGTLPYTYSWTPSGGASATATGLAAGNYTCTITDASSCSTIKTFIITEPNALTATATQTNVSCSGGNNGTATVTPSGGTSNYSYAWTPSGGGAATASSLSATNYTCTITDANSCTTTTTVSITQPTVISVNITTVPALCGSSTGQATATASGGAAGAYTYSWAPSGGSAATATALGAGNYTVTVTDANLCSITSPTTITNTGGPTVTVSNTSVTCFGGSDGTANAVVSGGTPTYTYSWLPAGGTAQNATGLSAGNYTITVTDNSSCVSTATVSVTEPNPITVIVNNTTICTGQSATLTAIANGGNPTYTYSWNSGVFTGTTINPSPTTNTSYSVIATDQNGCASLQAIASVTVKPPLSITTSPNDSICLGTSANLSATASGGNGNYLYSWAPGNQTGASVSVNPTTMQTYTVTVSDGCTSPNATATETVIIKPAPVVSFTYDNRPSCAPVCITFNGTATITPGSITSWTWNFGDGATSSMQNLVHCYTAVGTFTPSLSATGSNGCSSSYIATTQSLNMFPPPEASFTASDLEVTLINPEVTLTNTSTAGSSLNWTFADGSTSSKNIIDLQFDSEGSYPVSLIVTDSLGCSDTVTQTIYVLPDFTFYAPNAFTPSGDHINEQFLPMGTGWDTKKYQLVIFDRWGNKIFSTTDTTEGWNGKANGGSEIAQIDTYIWSVELFDIFNKKHNYHGQVQLIK